MHWHKCCSLAIIFCVASCQGSDDSNKSTKKISTATTLNILGNVSNSKLNDNNKEISLYNSTMLKNLKNSPKSVTALEKGANINLKSVKRNIENGTIDAIKSFLLFPILPFLFPRKTEETLSSSKTIDVSKPNTVGNGETNSDLTKPYFFFDLPFDLPQNPFSSQPSNASKIITVKTLTVTKSDDLKKKPEVGRKKRNSKKNSLAFFDEFSLFPDSEIEEFFPKPDFFFSNLPPHPKSYNKLSRRKRGMKKPDFKSDIKFFMDAVDRVFSRTKREFEESDPILNFLRGSETSFEDGKKLPASDGFFGEAVDIQEKSTFNSKSQGSSKLNDDHHNEPVIIFDNTVKIGEFRGQDDPHNKNKLKKKKRSAKILLENNYSERKIDTPQTNVRVETKNVTSKQENRKKRSNTNEKEVTTESSFTNVKSKEIRILPQKNASIINIGSNATIELKRKDSNVVKLVRMVNESEINIFGLDSAIKNQLRVNESSKAETPSAEKLELRLNYDKKTEYEVIKKNITDVLGQFLAQFNKQDEDKVMDSLEANDFEFGEFDWPEKETLQSINIIDKDYQGKRKKKQTFEEEYVEKEFKETQVANLNYLFFTVTLPTILAFLALLLICFLNLQIRGKICTNLFKVRQVMQEENLPHLARKLWKKRFKREEL